MDSYIHRSDLSLHQPYPQLAYGYQPGEYASDALLPQYPLLFWSPYSASYDAPAESELPFQLNPMAESVSREPADPFVLNPWSPYEGGATVTATAMAGVSLSEPTASFFPAQSHYASGLGEPPLMTIADHHREPTAVPTLLPITSTSAVLHAPVPASSSSSASIVRDFLSLSSPSTSPRIDLAASARDPCSVPLAGAASPRYPADEQDLLYRGPLQNQSQNQIRAAHPPKLEGPPDDDDTAAAASVAAAPPGSRVIALPSLPFELRAHAPPQHLASSVPDVPDRPVHASAGGLPTTEMRARAHQAGDYAFDGADAHRPLPFQPSLFQGPFQDLHLRGTHQPDVHHAAAAAAPRAPHRHHHHHHHHHQQNLQLLHESPLDYYASLPLQTFPTPSELLQNLSSGGKDKDMANGSGHSSDPSPSASQAPATVMADLPQWTPTQTLESPEKEPERKCEPQRKMHHRAVARSLGFKLTDPDSISSHDKKRHYLECLEQYVLYLHEYMRVIGTEPVPLERVSTYRGLSIPSIRTLLVHMEDDVRKLHHTRIEEEKKFLDLYDQVHEQEDSLDASPAAAAERGSPSSAASPVVLADSA